MKDKKSPDPKSGPKLNITIIDKIIIPQTEDFLKEIFAGCTGLVEIRLIPINESQNGKEKGAMPTFFEADKVSLKELEKYDDEAYHSCFGVATRKEKKGNKEAVFEVPALCVDIDCKDFADSKDSINEHIKTVEDNEGLKPSYKVDSGNGCHLYFLLDQPMIISTEEDRKYIESISKGFSKLYKGDCTWDISRVMRLPGTFNLKDQDKPKLCEVIEAHPNRKYRLSDFEKYKEELPVIDVNSDVDLQNIPDNIPKRFYTLLETDEKLKNTWEGKRSDLNDDSGSGYDISLAYQVLEHGFTESDTARILLGAPFEKTNRRTDKYLKLTIRKAKALLEKNNSTEKPKQADQIVELIEEEQITLFHNQFDEPFARIKVDGQYENCMVNSKQFKRWIYKLYWDKKNKVPNNESLKNALNIIEAKACYDGNMHELSLRVAWHEDDIWYDLGNRKAVKIIPGDWDIIDEPPILFRSYPHQKSQVIPMPCKGDYIYLYKILFHFLNLLDEEKRLLFICNLVAGFIPDIPHPIDVYYGEQGTSKTTISRIKKELLDPSSIGTLTYSSIKTEFIQLANHHWYMALDNLSELPGWLSDSLCRVVTGEGFSKRELYTNDEDIVYSFKRCVGLNGINMAPTKPDLLDRCLLFELEPIDPNKIKNEKDFWSSFNKMKPLILGALFTILSKAMEEYPDIKLSEKPRMADFASWGCAIAKAMGFTESDFLSAYKDNIATQNDEVLQSSPIASAIIELMKSMPNWEGTPTKLYNELCGIASDIDIDTKDKKWPKAPISVWLRINEVKTNLRKYGLKISRNDGNHSKGRLINIENTQVSIS